ncbi:MAG: hypothetical protein F4027_07450, partial [Rhodospirillaceae bacterium]|nr:hypothetical protein [Rhodospirillaceae bacterium]
MKAMPYRDPEAKRQSDREASRRYRARKKAEREALAVADLPPVSDSLAALAAWAKATLKVPPGHPLAGRPMALPDFAERFLRDGWTAHESALCMGRKIGKSAICAV